MVKSEDRIPYLITFKFRLYSTETDENLLKRTEPFFFEDLNYRGWRYMYILGFRGYSRLLIDFEKIG